MAGESDFGRLSRRRLLPGASRAAGTIAAPAAVRRLFVVHDLLLHQRRPQLRSSAIPSWTQ